MNCEFDYCIHNIDFKCRYESISINGYGMCDECTIISIDEKKLKIMKQEQINDFIKRTKER